MQNTTPESSSELAFEPASEPSIDRGLLTTLVRSAGLAPSSHNTQPWVFRLSSEHIDLLADRTRALPVNDPDDRELIISCGCALFNLRVEAAHQGLSVHAAMRLDELDPDCLARVSINGRDRNREDALIALEPYIDRRRTCRKAFEEREVDASIVRRLQDAAQAEGGWMEPLITGQARRAAADLVALGAAAQWADPGWRRELAAWMRARRQGDGLAVSGIARPVAKLIVRTFDLGRGAGAKDRQLAEGSPLLAVLGTARDDPPDWMRAGQALQRVLLVACQLGLQASHLNQPVQVAALRGELKNLVGADGPPQLLLRFGYPLEEIPAAPRRPVEEIIEFIHD